MMDFPQHRDASTISTCEGEAVMATETLGEDNTRCSLITFIKSTFQKRVLLRNTLHDRSSYMDHWTALAAIRVAEEEMKAATYRMYTRVQDLGDDGHRGR
jgi:hypothetical protein